ncbi:MAG: hypothetical protein DMG61_05380 [Acidobacteria bacterium]|nr:MAG: hypothetical protein DMG60_21880 [Acidobacteriota bacterium]PYY16063.1 MAG: hypothetical protein DMG61_05380 [Acidobacteriota bacterium]
MSEICRFWAEFDDFRANSKNALLFSLFFLFPGYEDKVFTLSQPFTLGEVATMLWLAIMGAREPHVAAAMS